MKRPKGLDEATARSDRAFWAMYSHGRRCDRCTRAAEEGKARTDSCPEGLPLFLEFEAATRAAAILIGLEGPPTH